MSLIVSRARSTPLPNLLAWRALGFRTICSGRLGLAPSSPYSPAPAGTKILESFKEKFEVGSGVITLETGKIARFANGSVVLGMDETKVLSTVTCAKSNSPGDFLPLTVCFKSFRFLRLWLYAYVMILYRSVGLIVNMCLVVRWETLFEFPTETGENTFLKTKKKDPLKES